MRARGDNNLLTSIQALRAVAALAVVVAHAHYEFANRLGTPGELPGLEAGVAGVDLFFVISGFVILHSAESLFGAAASVGVFLRRRALRIVPMYWLASAMLCAWVAIRYGSFEAAHWSPGMVAASFVFLPYDGAPLLGVGWTIYYEALFYCLFALVVWLPRARALALLVAVLAVIAATRAPLVIEFMLGMGIAELYRRGVRLSASIGAALAVVGVVAFIYAPIDFAIRQVWVGIPCAAIVAAAALAPQPRYGRAVMLLGDASYSLYLFHPFAFTVARAAHGWHGGGSALYTVELLVASVAAGVGIYLCIERPLTAWLKAKTAARHEGERRQTIDVRIRRTELRK